MAKKLPVYSICTIKGGEKGTEDFMAARFSEYLSTRGYLLKPHGHSFYHMVLFTGGGGQQGIDFTSFPVKPGQIYFMVPGQVHHWAFTGKVEGYIVNFSPDLFNDGLPGQQGLDRFSFFRDDPSGQVIQLTSPVFKTSIAILETLLKEVQHVDSLQVDMLRSLLLQLFITVGRQAGASSATSSSKPGTVLIRNFQSLINTHFREKKLPSDYAALLYVTPNYLNSLSKDLLGKPAGEVIRDRIMLEAKRMLVNADKHINEIANELDFRDNSYFSKFFKKYSGKTPEDFRKTYHIDKS